MGDIKNLENLNKDSNPKIDQYSSSLEDSLANFIIFPSISLNAKEYVQYGTIITISENGLPKLATQTRLCTWTLKPYPKQEDLF